MTTHADLLAAIDKARADETTATTAALGLRGNDERNAHLDTLRAILDLHQPYDAEVGVVGGPDWCCVKERVHWPCASVQVVADALTRMGALP